MYTYTYVHTHTQIYSTYIRMILKKEFSYFERSHPHFFEYFKFNLYKFHLNHEYLRMAQSRQNSSLLYIF